MNQAKTPRMQCLSWELGTDRHPAGAVTVDLITDQRMPERRHVHANLVRTPGFQRTFDQRAIDEAFDDPKVRPRRLAALNNRHLRSLRRMPTDRLVDGSARFQHAAHQRLVVALDRPRLKLAHQIGLRLKRFGDDHQAGRILVQTMHDAGPRHFLKRRFVIQQGVEQGPSPVAAAGMHNQAGRLVEHDQRFVLMHDVERDRFGRRGKQVLVRRFDDLKQFTAPELLFRLADDFSADTDAAFADPVLQAVSRVFGPQADERLIEPQAAAIARNGQSVAGVCAIIDALFAGPGMLFGRNGLGPDFGFNFCFLMWNFHHA